MGRACCSAPCSNRYRRPATGWDETPVPKRLIVDAQSVKNADTAGLKGYDAGKQISGIKRHIAVDTQGLPHAVAVSTAEVTDRLGTPQALRRCKPSLGLVQSVLGDGGCVGEPFAQGVREAQGEHVTVQIAKRSELHTFAVIPKRWVVERSFACGIQGEAAGLPPLFFAFLAGAMICCRVL